MSVASKLQIKSGQDVAVLRKPAGVTLEVEPNTLVDDPASADAVVVFVRSSEDLSSPEVEAAVDAGRRDGLAWVAYPKAGQLGTDVNRDSLAARLSERGVRPVRQISIDDTWSALRFRPES
jgi:hypothetical protein